MEGFGYISGRLMADKVCLSRIAEEYGTPAYVYSASYLRSRYKALENSLGEIIKCPPLIAYACKSNSNQAVLKVMASMGAGADIVSGGEMIRCLKAGIPADKIVFSGVSKSEQEIELAVKNSIRQINVESEFELHRISEVASRLGKEANVTFRFNPDIAASTHEKISTGRAKDKFGIIREDIERLYEQAASMDGINIRGLHAHIGSQITDVEDFRASYQRLADLASCLVSKKLPLDTLDLGGGIGIIYKYGVDKEPDLKEYARIISETVGKVPGAELVIEPGRFITADAGVLLASLMYVKESAGRKFAVLDAGMNDLMRPALYGSWHEILPLNEKDKEDTEKYDVVGPVCETGDTFAKHRELSRLDANGELLAIMSAGAYGAAMSSNYNTRGFAPEIMVDGEKIAVIRKRQTIEDLIESDEIPPWL